MRVASRDSTLSSGQALGPSLSAFSGAGFATREAEKVFGTRVRIAAPTLRTPEAASEGVEFYSARHEYLHDTTYGTVLGLVKYGYLSQLATQESSRGLLRRLFSL